MTEQFVCGVFFGLEFLVQQVILVKVLNSQVSQQVVYIFLCVEESDLK